MKLARHGSSGLSIVNALKLTKSSRRSKSDLTTLDFDNIDERNVKNLPSFLESDILFVLPPLSMGVSNMYGHSINDIEKMCNRHP